MMLIPLCVGHTWVSSWGTAHSSPACDSTSVLVPMCPSFSSRKIVAEYEKTIAQMIGGCAELLKRGRGGDFTGGARGKLS